MRAAAQIRTKLSSVYRGWWVLLGVTLLALISGGILYHGAAVFFIPIRRDLNLSSANTSLIFTISRAQASLVAPLYGWLVDRVGRGTAADRCWLSSIRRWSDRDHPHPELPRLSVGLYAAGVGASQLRLRSDPAHSGKRMVHKAEGHRPHHSAYGICRRRCRLRLPTWSWSGQTRLAGDIGPVRNRSPRNWSRILQACQQSACWSRERR